MHIEPSLGLDTLFILIFLPCAPCPHWKFEIHTHEEDFENVFARIIIV